MEVLTVDDVGKDSGLLRLSEPINSSDSLELEGRRERRFQEEDVLGDSQRQTSTFPLAVKQEDLDERVRLEGSSDVSRVGASSRDEADSVLRHGTRENNLLGKSQR